MEFTGIMHVAFYVDDMERILDFYQNKLGLKLKMAIKAKTYMGNKAKGAFAAYAEKDPEMYVINYVEVVPGQFIEFFPKADGQKEHDGYNASVGYSHFSLLVDDIYKARDELVAKGVDIDVEPTIGNSKTWKMWIHDPEGNRIEIMQFTDESYPLVGHID